MKKNLKQIIVIIACIVLTGAFSPIPKSKAFSDVTEINKYFRAIEYLVKKKIIHGYPDNTFQPFKNISRVEFLKIALSASNVSVKEPLPPSGFPDVDEKSWYAPFIKKAKNEGWISGYTDGTFKPEQPITRVEALKIIGKVQNWNIPQPLNKAPYTDTPLLAWYTPYVAYAKNKNFLEEKGPFFRGYTFIMRGEVSEVLFRTAITQEKKALVFSTKLLEEDTIVSPSTTPPPVSETSLGETGLSFEPVEFKTLPQDFFSDILLEEKFPNTFYLNEVYFFKGKTKNTAAKKIFIFLAPPDDDMDHLKPGNFIEYSAEPANDGSFEIPVIFRKPGNYHVGLIVGNAGESKITTLSVLPTLPTLGSTINNLTPPSPDITYDNGKTTVHWDSAQLQFFKINFHQPNREQSFFFRQPIDRFDLDFEDFKNFKEGTTNITIQSATLQDISGPISFSSGWSAAKSKSFKATFHSTIFNQENAIENLKIAEILPQVKPIEVKGITKVDILAEGAVIKPDGTVENVDLDTTATKKTYYGQETIPFNSSFTFRYTPPGPGNYIIEINDRGGEAVINMPIYVQTGIPLIPDFFDLYYPENKQNFDLVTFRQELLNLINKERVKLKRTPVELDNALNNLAQLHTEDMKKRNFFGHINPDNETPDDRRKEAGIQTMVGENLALAPSIAYAHEGLMRSATHRKNILDPNWQKVGLGITQKGNGMLVAQEFSLKPLTATDIDLLKKNIIDSINQKKSHQNLALLQEDTFLHEQGQKWSDKMVNENFFKFTSPNGENLSSSFSNYPSIVQAYIVSSTSPEKIIEQIIGNNQIIDSTWSKVGIGLSLDPTGLLKGTLLLTGN